MIPVVLSGGSGTRLWPLSRTKLPKQFCTVFEKSLHSMTLLRLQKIGSPWVVTSHSLRDLTVKNMSEIGIDTQNMILEPKAKNTAPAIAIITALFMKKGLQNEVVGIFPADHLIDNEEGFLKAISLAESEARKDKIVTIGIHPAFPATGYGYIQTSKVPISQDGQHSCYSVLQFHEKPTVEKAIHFLEDCTYQWNAGIFIFNVGKMAKVFQTHQPAMWDLVWTLDPSLSNIDDIYSKVENISIDYAIMEKLSFEDLACVPCDIGWNDVGSWDAIADILGDAKKTNLVELNSNNNFTHSTLENKVYAYTDVADLIVVDTPDALLITKKGSSQSVKDIVEALRSKTPNLLAEHVFEERPWGHYEVLKNTESFKSKFIRVNPRQQISYQSHSQREEHWLITKGQGEVILNDEVIPIKPGSYIKIPLGAKHRIRSSGDSIVEFVEVQMGSYFGEDDIIRYQDDYCRI